MEPDHPDDSTVLDDGGLKAVVARKLLAGAPDEGQRVLECLPGRPRHPARQMIAVDVDDRIQLLRIRLLEQTKPTTLRAPNSKTARWLTRGGIHADDR